MQGFRHLDARSAVTRCEVGEGAGDLDRVQRDPTSARQDGRDQRRRDGRAVAGEHLPDRVVGKALEVERREARHPGPPARPPLEQLRPSQGHDQDRMLASPRGQVLDEVEQARVGPLDVLEDEHRRCRVGDALEEATPRREELIALECCQRIVRQQHRQPRLHPGAFGVVPHDLGEGRSELTTGQLRLGVIGEANPPSQHVPHRREGDLVAVGWRAPRVPEDLLGECLDLLAQLPRQATLADARDTGHGNQPAAPIAHGSFEEADQLGQLVVPADERAGVRRAFDPVCRPAHRARQERDDRRGPSLQRKLADGLVGGGHRRHLARRRIHQDAAGWRVRLEASRGVDEVPGDHALPDGTQGDGRLPAAHRGPRGE